MVKFNQEDEKNIWEIVDEEYSVPNEYLKLAKKEAKSQFIFGVFFLGFAIVFLTLFFGLIHNNWSLPLASGISIIVFLWIMYYFIMPIWHRHMYISYKRRKNAKFSCIAAFNSYALIINKTGGLVSIFQILGYHLDDTRKVSGLIGYNWERPINYPENSYIIIATSKSLSIVPTEDIYGNDPFDSGVVNTIFSIDEFIENLISCINGSGLYNFQFANILENQYFWDSLETITGLNYNEELLKKGQIALKVAKENKNQGLDENTSDNSQI